MDKCVLITGATSGIGEATAVLLASEGYRLILTGRRRERLESLRKRLIHQNHCEILTLSFDICSLKQVEEAIDSIPENFKSIDILINNAGLAVGLSSFQEGLYDDWERMIDTNLKGILYITRKVVPRMAEKKSGHIINISSIAGKETYPMGSVYCASKHAVQSLSKAMRLDLLKDGIKVTTISPGAVLTEFSLVRFKGDKERADQVYSGIRPLAAADVAEAIFFALSRPPHVNIDDILIMPTDQAFSRDFNRH
jgi:3-hydroxy acid dehydrogenase / malonic semialdehyde reductase